MLSIPNHSLTSPRQEIELRQRVARHFFSHGKRYLTSDCIQIWNDFFCGWNLFLFSSRSWESDLLIFYAFSREKLSQIKILTQSSSSVYTFLFRVYLDPWTGSLKVLQFSFMSSAMLMAAIINPNPILMLQLIFTLFCRLKHKLTVKSRKTSLKVVLKHSKSSFLCFVEESSKNKNNKKHHDDLPEP